MYSPDSIYGRRLSHSTRSQPFRIRTKMIALAMALRRVTSMEMVCLTLDLVQLEEYRGNYGDTYEEPRDLPVFSVTMRVPHIPGGDAECRRASFCIILWSGGACQPIGDSVCRCRWRYKDGSFCRWHGQRQSEQLGLLQVIKGRDFLENGNTLFSAMRTRSLRAR